jgi:hypothetical protein
VKTSAIIVLERSFMVYLLPVMCCELQALACENIDSIGGECLAGCAQLMGCCDRRRRHCTVLR